MLAPFTTASRRTPHYHSPGVATVVSHATYASMSTRTTTTTTTRDRGDCYGPMEWAQSEPEGTQLLPTCHTKVNTMWLLGSSRCVHQRRLQWGSGCNLHPLWHKGRISLIGGGERISSLTMECVSSILAWDNAAPATQVTAVSCR